MATPATIVVTEHNLPAIGLGELINGRTDFQWMGALSPRVAVITLVVLDVAAA